MADNTTELEVLDEIVDVLGGQSGQYETVVPTLQQILALLGGVTTDIEALLDLVRGNIKDISDWDAMAEIVATGDGGRYLPVGTQFVVPWSSTGATKTDYEMPLDVAHFCDGEIEGGEAAIPLMYLQTHYCLPDGMEFSPKQAFLYAIDGLPAGTYNVTVASTVYEREAGDYQFTLTQDLPAGGQLAGFFSAGKAASVQSFASQTAASPIETCEVTSGSGGTNLGTFSVAGVPVPASGTPESHQTVNIGGTDYTYYGLNSQQRVSYGNNRWLHSAIRQWLNASGDDWWQPQTVFDRPPAYTAHKGYLTYLDPDLIAAMVPVKRDYALSYVCDGGTAANPVADTCYDKVFLATWEEQYLKCDSSYGAKAGYEGCGEPWDYWKQAKGTSTSPAAGTTNPEYIRLQLNNKAAAGSWLASCYRYSGYSAACVTSSGACGGSYAMYALSPCPACAIGKSD